MSGPTEHRASGPLEKPSRSEGILTLPTARRMVPLVRRVVRDLQDASERRRRLRGELAGLERRRLSLGWPERLRRYHLAEEVAETEEAVQEALAELEVLGLVLLDLDDGRVGFPTLVNHRLAYFSWSPAEDAIRSWQFADERARRAIPASWEEREPALPGKA